MCLRLNPDRRRRLAVIVTVAIATSCSNGRAESAVPVTDGPTPITAPAPTPITAPPVLALALATTAALTTMASPVATPSLSPPQSAGRRLRIMVVGDSTALVTGGGLQAWGELTGELEVVNTALMGCGIGRGGWRRYSRQESAVAVPEHCADPEARWRFVMALTRFDAIVVQTGPWDVTDRILPGDDTWRAAGDPVYDAYLSAELEHATQVLGESGAPVLWLTAPEIELGRLEDPRPSEPYPGSDPSRVRRLNELITEVADRSTGAEVIDLRGYLAALPGGVLDARMRPDGVHFTTETSVEVAQWLGPMIVEHTKP